MSQIILFIGASKGIGLQTANKLYQHGHTVYGTSRNPNKANNTDFELLAMDVGDTDSVQQAVDHVVTTEGRIDVLINNAGYDLYGAAEETSMEELIQQVDTNFFGVVRAIQAVAPIMRQQQHGKIINTSSIGGLLSLPFNSAYAASKYALEGYSESLRYELMPFNVYVSLVEPGGVRTNTLDTSIIEVQEGHVAYEKRRANMVNHMRNLSATGVSMEAVANTILKITETAKPRLRYAVGNQARFSPTMKLLLPQGIYERFIKSQFAIAFK